MESPDDYSSSNYSYRPRRKIGPRFSFPMADDINFAPYKYNETDNRHTIKVMQNDIDNGLARFTKAEVEKFTNQLLNSFIACNQYNRRLKDFAAVLVDELNNLAAEESQLKKRR